MHDRNEQVLAVAVTFLVLCWIVVGLRVYCRVHVVKSFGPDDFSLVVLQFWFVCELLYIACTCLLKQAAGQFLLRLAVDARHVWALRALMLSTALFGTAYFFLVLFQCGAPAPRGVFWEESPRAAPGDRCWSDLVVLALTYAVSAVNCLADWCFGLMPVLVVRTLNMPRGTRVLVACLTSFAAIASIATVVRMVYIPTLLDGDDFLFQTTDVALWSTVEVGIGIAALSLAALHPLIAHWRRRLGLAHVPLTGSLSNSNTTPLSPQRRRRSRFRGGRRHQKYMRTDSRDPRQQQVEERSRPPLKLRPEESILYISSASGPPPPAASCSPPDPGPGSSRFALSSWIEEAGGRGSRSSSRCSHYHHNHHCSSRSHAGSSTELADWGGGITKTTEVSQSSQHRLDSLPRMDAVLLLTKRAPDEMG
ncbi:uncharacterized protein PG986_004845 [Apiospora aurea]|uniref:Integral membrane protein n=1 Tax=Apiospora aurea TaxID=335848 RepID=A0ABR1QFX2_9PEZI